MTRARATLKAADLQQMGVSKPYAHQLLAGGRTPSLKLALLIEAQFGIPPRAWAEAAIDTPISNLAVHDAAPVSDPANLPADDGDGAENPGENVSRTEGVAA